MYFGTLENAFYIIAIIFMGLMFILIAALAAAVFVIRAKVVHIQRQIQEKIDEASNLANTVAKVGGKAARAAARGVRKARNR